MCSNESRSGSGWIARADLVGSDDFYFDASHDEKSRAYVLGRTLSRNPPAV
jgi:hypothetical protein